MRNGKQNFSAFQSQRNLIEPFHLNFDSSISNFWTGSALNKESTIHQIAPYIGKMKSTMANTLISTFTKKEDFIYDPFCGSGTVGLEAWICGRNTITTDLNPYAVLLTQAKLNPILDINEVMSEIASISSEVKSLIAEIDLRKVPLWVRNFFHKETLREILAWCQILKSQNSFFLLACLLGILHHQRPGFLSFPSSHSVPYLRKKKFPPDENPSLYEYRPVQERLEKKIKRTLRKVPSLDSSLIRKCYLEDPRSFNPEETINAIITSPPYANRLDYGRDNRLRLWFLDVKEWKALDKKISPSEEKFLEMFRTCFEHWHEILAPKSVCVFVLGDKKCKTYDETLPDTIEQIATKEIGGYSSIWKYTESIPDERRVRRGCSGSMTETILVLKYEKER